MARDFDGNNDNLTNDNGFTALVNIAAQTVGAWIFKRTSGGDCIIQFSTASGTGTNRRIASLETNAGSPFTLQSVSNASVQLGAWSSNGTVALNVRTHICVTLDLSSTSNDPVFYVNGAVSGTTETITPSGTFTVSDVDSVRMGERAEATSDYDGLAEHAFCADSIFSAEEVNRAMWWGRARGGMIMYFPFVTTKLANDGSQSASLTASGSTVTGFATPVVRPGSVMMGMGVGW